MNDPAPNRRNVHASRGSMLQELLDLLDPATDTAQVNDGMAVGAHWPEIGNRVHLVRRTNLRQRLDAVNVDEPFGERPIDGAEVEPADHTGRPVVGDAARPGDR